LFVGEPDRPVVRPLLRWAEGNRAVEGRKSPRERDRIFQFDDVRVFVDPKSFIYLHGMILDYQETLIQQGFVFVNPNSTKSCGCGTSFSA